MTNLETILSKKPLIIKTAQAFGLEYIMLTKGKPKCLNLIGQKSDKSEEKPEDKIGMLETYLSKELDCKVRISITNRPVNCISLEASEAELTKFYGLLPVNLKFAPSSWGPHNQSIYETTCKKLQVSSKGKEGVLLSNTPPISSPVRVAEDISIEKTIEIHHEKRQREHTMKEAFIKNQLRKLHDASLEPKDKHVKYQALENLALELKNAEFFIERGHFYYLRGKETSNLLQQKIFYVKAEQDYLKALDFNPFIEEMSLISKRIKSLKKHQEKDVTNPNMFFQPSFYINPPESMAPVISPLDTSTFISSEFLLKPDTTIQPKTPTWKEENEEIASAINRRDI